MTTLDQIVTPPVPDPKGPPKRSGRWIEDWRPEDLAFWKKTGSRVARRNLLFSIFSEHIGFSIWSLWSVFD
jgi:NNP family nitrate/nitrite transporter-like MFS transporter